MKADLWIVVLIQIACTSVSAFVARSPEQVLPADHHLSDDKKVSQAAESSNIATTTKKSLFQDFDYQTQDSFPWRPEGYETWQWRGHNINYIALGNNDHSKNKPALLFLHGWGASAYHFRNNLPSLARHNYRVYAMDLLGFGLSDKPLIGVDYSTELWRDQTADFIQQVIQTPAIVIGNSLGALIALYTCTLKESQQSSLHNNMIQGCILMNVAGGFRSNKAASRKISSLPILGRLLDALQRFAFKLSYRYVRNPKHIAQILHFVYPVHPERVDDELVEAIYYPALMMEPNNCAEVYYRVSVAAGSQRQVFVDELLEQLLLDSDCIPILLAWGVHDPWYGPAVADRIQALYPKRCQRIDINAGHCPHDEAPQETNAAILSFLQQLEQCNRD